MPQQPPQIEAPPLTHPSGIAYLWEYLLAHQDLPKGAAACPDPRLHFLSFCLDHFTFSRAQLLQDLYVLFKLNRKQAGYFVEFGATDGMSLSNTSYLESHWEWDGLLAEPNPAWHRTLAANRRAKIDHRCVWKSSGAKLPFVASRAPEFSSLRLSARSDHHAESRLLAAHEIEVETIALDDLLAFHGAPGIIDYLSVDTEGSEFEILAAADYERHRFRVITVEHNYVERIRADIHRLLTAKGYLREFETLSKWDDWYYHPDLIQPVG